MEYYADIGVQILFLVMLGVSLNLLLGYAGAASLAHATFYGVGAYTVGLLTLPPAATALAQTEVIGLGWSLWPAVAVAVILAFVLASAISLPAISRVRGEYLILLTLAFQIIANQLMHSARSVTGGAYGITPIPPLEIGGQSFATPVSAFWLFLILAAVVCAISYGLGESPFGRLLKGIREHESAVTALGKDTVRPKVVVFGVAAALAGFAGALNASYYQFVAPGSFDLNVSILIIAVVVLGGVGNLLGTIVAAIVLGSLPAVLRGAAGDEAIAWQAVIYGLALVVLIRFRPAGLIPEGTGPVSWLRAIRPAPAGQPPDGQAASRSPAAAPDGGVGGPSGSPDSSPDGNPGGGPGRPSARGGDGAAEQETVLRVSGLSKRFGGIQAVDDVTFELSAARITALIGPNGAGKTTIFNLMAGAIIPDAGEVVLHGEEITDMRPHRIVQRGMARSFQDGRLFERLSAVDNVAMAIPDQPGEKVIGLGLHPLGAFRRESRVRDQAREALAFVGLDNMGDEIAGNLAFGDQRLVAIARLLATGCGVLLLDEPTSGVDPAAVDHVIGVVQGLRDVGKTVCLVEHSVHVVEQLADHGIFLDQGRVIAEGSVDDLMEQEHLTEIYFG